MQNKIFFDKKENFSIKNKLPKPEEIFLTTGETAQLLGLSRNGVLYHILEGHLDAVSTATEEGKRGLMRIYRESAEELYDKRQKKGAI